MIFSGLYLQTNKGYIMRDRSLWSEHWINFLTILGGVVSSVAILGYVTGQKTEMLQSFSSKTTEIQSQIDKIHSAGTVVSQRNSWEIDQLKDRTSKLEADNKQLNAAVNEIKVQVGSMNAKIDQIIELLKKDQQK